MAAIAQYELTETDLDDVLAEMNEGVGLISGWAQEKDDEERLSTRQVHTSLLLIDGWEHVEEHHLLAFSKDELTQIFEWATAEHLYASDNSVERRSRPACLIHLSPHRIQLIRNRTEGV